MISLRTLRLRVSGPGYSRREIYGSILTLAWPAILEQLLVMMVGVVSTVFVGRIGTKELAAVGLVNMIVMFVQTVFSGLATGATVVIARQTGEGDGAGVKRAIVQSLVVGVVTGIGVTLPALVFSRSLLGLFFGGVDPEVGAIGLRYFRLVMLGTPFFVVDLVVAGAVRGTGDTRTPMLVTLAANVVNIVLSYTLIFGLPIGQSFRTPAFGVTGAGIAVMATRIFAGTVRTRLLFRTKRPWGLGRGERFRPDRPTIARIVRVGFPAFMEQFIMQGGFLAVQVIIISLGVVQSAAYQVGVNVNSLAFMPTFGLSIATTTIVGQSLGRSEPQRAGIYALEAISLGVAIISSVGFLIAVFAPTLVRMYSSDPDVVRTASMVIRIFALTSPFLGVMNVSASILRAAGDILFVTISAIVGLWIFRLGLAWLLTSVYGLGLPGVLVAIVIDFTVRSTMYGLRVRAGRWLELKV